MSGIYIKEIATKVGIYHIFIKNHAQIARIKEIIFFQIRRFLRYLNVGLLVVHN